MKYYYKTVAQESSGIYREKGSKFISYLYPVENTQEVEHCLAELKKKHHDARHHCYAYTKDVLAPIQYVQDAGEPAHTAGDPILGQIKSADLNNVLLVVIRYFGGTKLGKSGLIQAYKLAAKDAIDQATIITRYLVEKWQIKVLPSAYSQLINSLKKWEVPVLKQNFGQEYELEVALPYGDKALGEAIQKLQGVSELRNID